MNNKLDPETLKIPAYMRKKMIVSQARQKLILTALDRKQAHLPPNSTVAMAPVRMTPVKRTAISKTPRTVSRFSTAPSFVRAPVRATMRTPKIGIPPQTSIYKTEKSFPQIGHVTHYLDKISVAIVMLSAPLKIGDHVIIEGEGELFIQEAEEMQIDRQPVNKAKKGAHIGLKVYRAAKVNGSIYKLS